MMMRMMMRMDRRWRSRASPSTCVGSYLKSSFLARSWRNTRWCTTRGRQRTGYLLLGALAKGNGEFDDTDQTTEAEAKALRRVASVLRQRRLRAEAKDLSDEPSIEEGEGDGSGDDLILDYLPELAQLPRDALELLCAAGYVKQDEWHELHPRMKRRQAEAKRERELGFQRCKDLVLSGARQAEDSLAYDGQDPEDFLRNAQDFFDELSWHYRKGSYKDVCLADALRDRSSRPKTMEDLRRSVEYSIPAPERTREEQLEYRRCERLLYELEDAHSAGNLSLIVPRLRLAGLVGEDPACECPGRAAATAGEVLGALAGAGFRAGRVDFCWLETVVDGTSEEEAQARNPRSVHVDYNLVHEEWGGVEVESEWRVGDSGLVDLVVVRWRDGGVPGEAFAEAYAAALKGLSS